MGSENVPQLSALKTSTLSPLSGFPFSAAAVTVSVCSRKPGRSGQRDGQTVGEQPAGAVTAAGMISAELPIQCCPEEPRRPRCQIPRREPSAGPGHGNPWYGAQAAEVADADGKPAVPFCALQVAQPEQGGVQALAQVGHRGERGVRYHAAGGDGDKARQVSGC